MPDSFGNPTPQEIIAELTQQRNKSNPIGVGDPFRQASTNFEQIIGSALQQFDPRVVKAKKIEDALDVAREDAKKQLAELPEDATEADRRLITLKAQLEAVGGVDQNAADQLIERIVQAESQRQEMRRISAQERRTETEFQDTQGDRRLLDLERKGRMVVDQQSGESLGAIDISNPEDLAQFRKLRQENPNVVLRTMSDFADATDRDRQLRLQLEAALAKAKASSGLSQAIERRRFTADAKANNDFAATSTQFIDLLENSAGTFGAGGQAVAGLQRVGAHAKTFVQALNPNVVDVNNNRLDTALETAGITDARRRGLVIDLAYAIATSREGGRLTDQDIDRAIETVGAANPDTRAVARVFADLVRRRAEVWDDRLVLAGLQDDPNSQEAFSLVRNRYTEALERLNSIQKGFDPVEQGAGGRTVTTPKGSTVVIRRREQQ